MRKLKQVFAVGLAADVVIVICCVVSWRFESGQRIHDFLFKRSEVQYVTLFVFALAIVLLGHRLIQHVRSRRKVDKIRRGEDWREMPNSPFTEHIATLRDVATQEGMTSAFSRAERFAQERQKDIQRAYDSINFLVCSLPALGLFGTMLGLSSALFGAFSQGSFGSESIETFVSSLGTALDTSVLALSCALVIGLLAWLLNRTEKEFQEQRLEILLEVAGLNRYTPRSTNSRQSDSGQTPNADIVDAVRIELQASAAQNTQTVTEITSKFDGSVSRLEELVRASLERACQNEVAYNQEVDPTIVVQAIHSSLDQAMERITELVTTHNQDTTRTIAAALNRFAEAVESSNVVDTVRAEVRASMCEEMSEVNAKLQEHLGEIKELTQMHVERTAQLECEAGPQFDQASFVESTTSSLNQSIDRLGALLTEQNNMSIQAAKEAMMQCVNRLECGSKSQFDQNGLAEAVTTCLEKGFESIEQHSAEQNVKNLQSISTTIKTNQTRFMQAVMAYMASNEEEMTHVA